MNVLYMHYFVVDITPFTDSGDIEKHVAEGDAVIFDLPPVDSCPPASIQWTDARGSVLVNSAESHHVTLTNQLVILNTNYDLHNNAVYRAAATNGYTQQRSSSPLYVLRVQREYTPSTVTCLWSLNHSCCVLLPNQ